MKRLLLVFAFLLLSNSVWAASLYDKAVEAYDKQNYEQAFSLFLPLAESGDKKSQNFIGVMYRHGKGVAQDYKQALVWYRKAAEQGDADAQNNLSVMYEYGMGVAQDKQQAVTWCRKAVEQGYAKAQHNLGRMYKYGIGVTQDYKQALVWHRKAAEQGDADAQSSLGGIYQEGKGVEQDYEQAAAWYRKAAEQGNFWAQSSLGIMYESGKGVAQDYEQAAAWYRKAAEQGYGWAKKSLERLREGHQGCLGSTKLFETVVQCANRDSMMKAIKKAGAGVKREDKNKWGDTYYTSSVLKGTSELYVGYTVDDWFAYAEYNFPSHMDNQQVVRIKNMIVTKYGEPSYSSGKASLGRVTYKWQLQDGVELKVSRGWPKTTTYLRYTYPKNYIAMQNEMERQRKVREQEEAKAQSNAF